MGNPITPIGVLVDDTIPKTQTRPKVEILKSSLVSVTDKYFFYKDIGVTLPLRGAGEYRGIGLFLPYPESDMEWILVIDSIGNPTLLYTKK